jgi:hypothetical protein
MLLSQGVSYWDPPGLLAARRPQPGSQQQRSSQRHIPPSLHSARARLPARTAARSSPAHRLAHTESAERRPSFAALLLILASGCRCAVGQRPLTVCSVAEAGACVLWPCR